MEMVSPDCFTFFTGEESLSPEYSTQLQSIIAFSQFEFGPDLSQQRTCGWIPMKLYLRKETQKRM